MQIATEGPLGWSALHAARHLKLPVTSDFRTNFHAYSAHYGIGWLHKPIMSYLRRFHNATQCTMVPTDGQRRELESLGLRGISVVARGVDVERFSPHRRSVELRRQWGADEDDLVVACPRSTSTSRRPRSTPSAPRIRAQDWWWSATALTARVAGAVP